MKEFVLSLSLQSVLLSKKKHWTKPCFFMFLLSLCFVQGPVLWCVGTLMKFLKIPLCVGSVLWGVETLKFFKVPLCVCPVLWCVESLKFFKVPLCVSSVLWCVRTLSF